MRWWLPVVLVCVLVGPAVADPPPVFELPEVLVPGPRPQPLRTTPASVTVITRADLERIGARTVAEALRLVPETTVRAYGGFGSLAEASIRGFGPGQVLVLIDGIPVNNVALGQADLSTISTAGVERIEVLRGAFGAISGSGALGGVINIVTGGGGSTVRARNGSYGEHLLRVDLGGPAGSLTLESASTAGARPNSDAAGFTARGAWPLGGGRVSVHHTRLYVGTPGDVAFPTPQDRQALIRSLGQFEWGGADDPWRVRLSGGTESLTFASPFGGSTFNSTQVAGTVQRQWRLTPARLLVVGFEAQRQALDATVFGSPIVRDATVAAGFAQLDAALSPRALLSTAVRVDAHSSYGAAVNPRAGVVVTLDEATLLRVGAGRTFRGPTFLHLYYPGCSDPALRPESAWTAEASIERAARWGRAVFTVFQTDAVNLISGGCPPQNIGAAFVRGASVEARAAWGPWSVLVHATLQEAVDRTTGTDLPRVPAFSAQAAVTRVLGPGSLTLLAGHVGPRRDLDFSVFPAAAVTLPGYTDVAVRYERAMASGWTIVAGADNLLDVRYEVVKGYPVPGRTFFLAASRRF
ncbi:MAG TPA: TonB-dependent receptor [bacterium]|nr:TonB-dependent receptor [bacterium]